MKTFNTFLGPSIELTSDHEDEFILEVDNTWRNSLRYGVSLHLWLNLLADQIFILLDIGVPPINTLPVSIQVSADLDS